MIWKFITSEELHQPKPSFKYQVGFKLQTGVVCPMNKQPQLTI